MELIFLNDSVCVLIKISLNFVPEDPVAKKPALDQIQAPHRGLSEPLVSRHICIMLLESQHWIRYRRHTGDYLNHWCPGIYALCYWKDSIGSDTGSTSVIIWTTGVQAYMHYVTGKNIQFEFAILEYKLNLTVRKFEEKIDKRKKIGANVPADF